MRVCVCLSGWTLCRARIYELLCVNHIHDEMKLQNWRTVSSNIVVWWEHSPVSLVQAAQGPSTTDNEVPDLVILEWKRKRGHCRSLCPRTIFLINYKLTGMAASISEYISKVCTQSTCCWSSPGLASIPDNSWCDLGRELCPWSLQDASARHFIWLLRHPTQIASFKLGKFRLSFLGNLLAGCANIYLAPGAALTPWLLQWLFSSLWLRVRFR